MESSRSSQICQARELAQEAWQMLDEGRKHPSLSLLQGIVALWVYECNSGNNLGAAYLLEDIYHTYDTLGLNDLGISSQDAGEPTSTSTGDLIDARRDWKGTCCIVWELFFLDA